MEAGNKEMSSDNMPDTCDTPMSPLPKKCSSHLKLQESPLPPRVHYVVPQSRGQLEDLLAVRLDYASGPSDGVFLLSAGPETAIDLARIIDENQCMVDAVFSVLCCAVISNLHYCPPITFRFDCGAGF